jgi:hypothetical protein
MSANDDQDIDIKELPLKIDNDIKRESLYKKLVTKADKILEKLSEKELKQKVS